MFPQLTDEQWTSLKAIAPVLAVVATLLSALVAATTAWLIASYNARRASDLARTNAIRTDRVASMKKCRGALAELHEAVMSAGSMQSREDLTQRTSRIANASQVVRGPAFNDLVKGLGEASLRVERENVFLEVSTLILLLQELFLNYDMPAREQFNELAAQVDTQRLKTQMGISDFRKHMEDAVFGN